MLKMGKRGSSVKRHTTSVAHRQSYGHPTNENNLIENELSDKTQRKAQRIHRSIENIRNIINKKREGKQWKKLSRFTTDDEQLILPDYSQQNGGRQKKRLLFNIRTLNLQKKPLLMKPPQKMNKQILNLTYYSTIVDENASKETQIAKQFIVNQKKFAQRPPIHLNSSEQLRTTLQTEPYNLFLHRFIESSKMAAVSNLDPEFSCHLSGYLQMIREQCNQHNIEYNEFKSYPKQYLRYYIQGGNNDRMIMDILCKRWWWDIAFQDGEKQGVNFLWTQIVQKQHDQRRGRVRKLGESRKLAPHQLFANLKQICFFNHFKMNKYLTNNISLTFLMQRNATHRTNYNIFFPPTFYISELNNRSWMTFTKRHFSEMSHTEKPERRYWIIKNAENKRNFNFFKIMQNYNQIKEFIRQNTCSDQTFIIQEYIHRPMLYRNRKFDIQAYMLVTRLNGVTKGYWYREGFINVSHEEYTMKNLQPFVHLVSDSIQISHKKFGDFENKIRFCQFEKYCNGLGKQRFSFEEKVVPIMKDTAKFLIQSGQDIIFGENGQPMFQIFELKFVLGWDLTPWLISVNANHCLSTTSPTLQAIYPALIDDTFKLTLDLFFPPPTEWPLHKKFYMSSRCRENEYSLIYDERQRTQGCLQRVEDIEFWERVDEDIKVYEDIQGQGREQLMEGNQQNHSQIEIKMQQTAQG